MSANTPQQETEAFRRRNSLTGSHRTSFGSSIPRVRSTIANLRVANSQPSFDFLTGESTLSRPPSRGDGYRKGNRIPVTEAYKSEENYESHDERERRKKELDDLKSENKTLQYTIDNHKQEEELSKLRYDTELRDARRKAEDDFKKMQVADSERLKAVRQYEALLKEMTEVRDNASNEKATLERKVREAVENKRGLEEEIEDMRTEREQSVRVLERQIGELETRNQTLQRTIEELRNDYNDREAALQALQKTLIDKRAEFGDLEAEVLRLKAQTGDADTLAIIKRELSEQVAHIKKLEITNRELATELKHYKRICKSVEVVEEEKRSLQRRLEAIEGLENELGEARIQRQRLEDERLAWTAYLKDQAGSDGKLEFDSPEAIARALVAERLQNLAFMERIGFLEPELDGKDSIIEDLEKEKSTLLEQLEKLKTVGGTNTSDKAQLRLERQKALAVKEVEYLRAQLKIYDTEDNTFQPEQVDEAKAKRIIELENMIDQYRDEVQYLNGELVSKGNVALPVSDFAGNKRKRDGSEESERQDQLIRKNRKLQSELNSFQTKFKLLEKELLVTKERLEAASQQSKTRILSLRSNPTSDYEAIKLSTLKTLRQENGDLLHQLQHQSPPPQNVPLSALEAAQQLTHEGQRALASEQKRNDRLMKVWGAKSLEFRQMVISLLGWDVVFMRDGKTRLTSFFYPSVDDDENSIVFDGERGTMKVSGGPQSRFALKIADQIRFWCKERASIPCFLAALTLEFWEEKHADGTLSLDA